MDREMLQYLTHAACNRIDKIIDAMPKPASEEDFAECNRAIQQVRNHLESRAMQTAVPFVPPTSEMLGDAAAWTELLPGMNAALDADAAKLAALLGAENSPAISAQDAELNALLGL
jgi:hypothetical protein